MDYIGRTKPAIRNLKKLPDSAEAHFFGALLAQEIRTALPDMEYSCVTAVPMSEEKRRKRRHNHAETLARCLAAELSLPYADNLLSQREDGVKQHDLSRAERIARAAACYRAVEGAAVSGRVILVDDVLTTGATLDCCASLLHTLGAEDVIAATAVSTPPDHDKKSERSGNNGVK
jgi:ComF family protein